MYYKLFIINLYELNIFVNKSILYIIFISNKINSIYNQIKIIYL